MDNKGIFEVEQIEFIFYDYLSFPKAERTSFYINLINVPLLLSDFDKKYSSFLYGINLKLKNHKEPIKGNEVIKITPSTEVCFFYCQYKVLFFLDLSHSMLIYDFDTKNFNFQKIETNLKLILENLLQFEKEVYSLKFEKIIFKPKLVFSFASTTNDDDFTILNHEMYLDLQHFEKYYSDCFQKKFRNIILNLNTRTIYPIPALTSLNGHFVPGSTNSNNLNQYIKNQTMYLNKILEQGLYILDLLSLNATPLFFLLTDSVLDLLFTGKYNNILMQLGRVDINLQIIDLSPNNMQLKLTSPVYLNNIELMKYIAKATGGNYFSEDYLNFILGGKMKKQYTLNSQNILNFDYEDGVKTINNSCNSFTNKSNVNTSAYERFIFCKMCDRKLSTFFCKKPFLPKAKKNKLTITLETIEKMLNQGFSLRSIEEFKAQSKKQFIQKEIFDTYQVRIPYDLIIEARVRESFNYIRKSKKPSSANSTIFTINLFPEIEIKYKILKKQNVNNDTQGNSTSQFSESEEYTIIIEIKAAMPLLASLKQEYVQNKHEIETNHSLSTRAEILLNFIKEIRATDRLIDYFYLNFSEEKDFQSEKDSYIKNNQLLWDFMGKISIHAWHRFFNVELIELLIKNSYQELDDETVFPFFQKNSKTSFISNVHKTYIENQIYKFCDIVKKDLNFGIKLIPKTLNSSNKKYINGFMLIKFNWIFENLCSINVAFFQSFHHTRTFFEHKFIEDLYNSTRNNDITIETSFRHLTSLLPKEFDAASNSQFNSSFSLSKPMSKKKIENYYFMKDLANVRNESGSIFTYRASKKLIDSFLHKKMERYTSQWQFCLGMITKFLILQRIKENFTIVKWNSETITLIAKIKIRKLINIDDISTLETKECFLLYSITTSLNQCEIITELSFEPNSGFFVNECSDGSIRIYDENSFMTSITKYFKNTEVKIIEWIKSYSFIMLNSINNKLSKEKSFSQLRNDFYSCYLNSNTKPEDIMTLVDTFKEELDNFSINFSNPKKKGLSANSFLRAISSLSEKKYPIQKNKNFSPAHIKSLMVNVKRLYMLVNDFFSNFKDYQVTDEKNNVYFGKIFSKTTVVFFCMSQSDKVLSQLTNENNQLQDITVELNFYYITIDALKELNKTFSDILVEKESLKTIDKNTTLILEEASNQPQMSQAQENTSIEINSKTYWNTNISNKKDITKQIIDNNIFKTSFSSFFSSLNEYIDFFIKLIIRYNNLISYITFQDTEISSILKDCYSFKITYPLSMILEKVQPNYDFVLYKLQQIASTYFIPLGDNYYCNDKPFADDPDSNADEDGSMSQIFTNNNLLVGKYYYIMEIYVVINDVKHPMTAPQNDNDTFKAFIEKRGYTGEETIHLEITYYFIPLPDDVFNEVLKAKYVNESLTMSIINKNNYSIHFQNSENSEGISEQIPVYIESEKEEYYFTINPKHKKTILNFEKNLMSLKHILDIEMIRDQINSQTDKEKVNVLINKGYELMKGIQNKFYYIEKRRFNIITNEKVNDYLKYITIKENENYSFDFINDPLCQKFSKEMRNKIDLQYRMSDTYKLPLWFRVSFNTNFERRRGSLDLSSNEEIFVEIKWIRLLDSNAMSLIKEISEELFNIVEEKVILINQRIMLDIIKETNEYKVNKKGSDFSESIMDETKRQTTFIKKDIERYFKNPFNDMFAVEIKIDEVFRYIKEHFIDKYSINNVVDYYFLQCNNEQDQNFIVKVSIEDANLKNPSNRSSGDLKTIKTIKSKPISKLSYQFGIAKKEIASKNSIGSESSSSFTKKVKRNILIQLYGVAKPSKTVIKMIKDIVSEKILIVKLNFYISLLESKRELRKLPEFEIFNTRTYKIVVNPMEKKIENTKKLESTIASFYNRTKDSWNKIYNEITTIKTLDIELLTTFSERVELNKYYPQFNSLTNVKNTMIQDLIDYYENLKGEKIYMLQENFIRKTILIPANSVVEKQSNEMIYYLFLIRVVQEGEGIDEKYSLSFELIRRKDEENIVNQLQENLCKKDEIISLVMQFLDEVFYVAVLSLDDFQF